MAWQRASRVRHQQSSSQHKRSLILPFSDKKLLVPLTSSLYVPGTLASTSHVLVDVGTGFYVEKPIADAQKFYEGKIEELGKNIKELENVVNSKANNLRVVEEILRQKMLQQQQEGGGAQAQTAGGA